LRDIGRNDPVDFLLPPGLDGTDVFFRPFLPRLPPYIRPLVVTYSDRGPQAYEHLLDEVRQRIAHLRRVVVLGSSFAGPPR